MSIFDELEQTDTEHGRIAERFDEDLNESVRLLMQRREGRVFINWLIEGQDPRSIMWRVMHYVEEAHG